MYAPARAATKNGSPPTEPNARTGEFTPPGMHAARAREPVGHVGVQALGDVAREVGEDDVGARPLDREQVLERDGRAVEPAELRGGFHHRVLTTHVVGRDRHVEGAAHIGDHVEIGERGLDHHHVGAFADVERDLGQRLAAVRRIHLVAAPVAELRRAFRRVAERPVQRGRRTSAAYARIAVVACAGLVERGTDRADLPVHHPARRDHVGAGIGLRDRDRSRTGRAWRRCRPRPRP